MEHSKKQIEAKHILEALSHVRQFTGDLAYEKGTIVFTIHFSQEGMASTVFHEAVGSCVAAHPYRFDERKDSLPQEDKPEAKRNRKKVKEQKGERFYEHQDDIIEGWELGTTQPPELVTDEGTKPARKGHKLLPDVENAKAKKVERQKKHQEAKKLKIRMVPDWLKELE